LLVDVLGHLLSICVGLSLRFFILFTIKIVLDSKKLRLNKILDYSKVNI